MSDLRKGNKWDVRRLIKKLWIIVSSDATPVCCEQNHRPPQTLQTMPIELFKAIVADAAANDWACRVVTNRRALPHEYLEICRSNNADLIVPHCYEGEHDGIAATVVVDQSLGGQLGEYLSPRQVIIRVRRPSLADLAKQLKDVAARVCNVSLCHPDLPCYMDDDFDSYREQLEQCARWVARGEDGGASFRLETLASPIWGNERGECNAGIEQLAIGPDGQAYLCPAFVGIGEPLGAFQEELAIPDQHLLSREYSSICASCAVDYCRRCIYQNKMSTREFAVAASRVCKLAHIEQKARTLFAEELKTQGIWREEWRQPVAPAIMDPFAIGERAWKQGLIPLWEEPALAANRPGEISPRCMVEVIHEIQAMVRAARRCRASGIVTGTAHLMGDSPLARARARTIDAYRDVTFSPDCPSLNEIERCLLESLDRIWTCIHT